MNETAKRIAVGHVIATVKVPVFAGDRESVGPWFEYNEPGVTASGLLGTVVRECDLIGQKYIPAGTER